MRPFCRTVKPATGPSTYKANIGAFARLGPTQGRLRPLLPVDVLHSS